MKLIAMVQVSGVEDEEEAIIAKLLTVSSSFHKWCGDRIC